MYTILDYAHENKSLKSRGFLGKNMFSLKVRFACSGCSSVPDITMLPGVHFLINADKQNTQM